MDVSVNKRLAIVLKEKRIKQVELAKNLKVSSQYISGIINGKNPVGIDLIKEIIKMCPTLNIKWLLSGEGNVWENSEVNVLVSKSTITPEEVIETSANDLKEILGVLSKMMKQAEYNIITLSDKYFIEIEKKKNIKNEKEK